MRCKICNKELELEKENEEYITINVESTTSYHSATPKLELQIPTFEAVAICDTCLDKIVDKLSERKKE